jgi:hypothetical protein
MLRSIKTNWYCQYNADFSLPIPAEGYQGWQTGNLELDLSHTALVIMHAWDAGSLEQYPGWYRHVEYLPRANKILKEIFPPLLKAVRGTEMKVSHVVGGGKYFQSYPGYKLAQNLTKKLSGRFWKSYGNFEHIPKSDNRKYLDTFRGKNCGSGLENANDISAGFKAVNFPIEAKPIGEEGIAENGQQLFALCKHFRIDHLIYCGFAINWCLLLSPGGMAEMSKYGLLCSTIREAVTAVENKESARQELNKEFGLWRVAIAFGFVFNLSDFLVGLTAKP